MLLAVFALLLLLSFLWRLRGKVSNTASSSLPTPKSIFTYATVPISPLLNFNAAATRPPPYRPWKAGKFAMTMGITRIPQEEWLEIDNCYLPEQALRRKLLDENRNGVMQILPGTESACVETLQMIVSFVTRRYPHVFYHPAGKLDYIHNSLTGKTFRINEPFEVSPLEVAAQLVMEDLNLLIRGLGDDQNQYYLAASFSMAPAGWYLQERIGWPLWKIHDPVPLWQEKLRKAIEKALLRMKPEDLIARHNFFIQTTDVLFQQEPFAASLETQPKIEDIRIRHERQTLRRLPKSGAILFTVRTYLTPIVDLADEPETIKELQSAIRALPENMARYKTRQVWGEVVEAWCEQQLERNG